MDFVVEHLKGHGIRPSVQRVAIMRYWMEHCSHPTVDDIYRDLHAMMPTLSRTTVYNTLSLLEGKDALSVLTIDSRNVHYDGDVKPHAHFMCRECRRIFDVPLAGAGLNGSPATPDGFKVEHTHLYYDGLCDRCREKEDAALAKETYFI